MPLLLVRKIQHSLALGILCKLSVDLLLKHVYDTIRVLMQKTRCTVKGMRTPLSASTMGNRHTNVWHRHRMLPKFVKYLWKG
jgi:hypothetical protein